MGQDRCKGDMAVGEKSGDMVGCIISSEGFIGEAFQPTDEYRYPQAGFHTGSLSSCERRYSEIPPPEISSIYKSKKVDNKTKSLHNSVGSVIQIFKPHVLFIKSIGLPYYIYSEILFLS